MPKSKKFLSSSNQYYEAWKDLADGLQQSHVWIELGLQEIKSLYRGSLIGGAWIVISFLIFSVALIWFFGGLTNSESSFFSAYLIIGLWIFQFLSISVTSGCTIFIASENWLRSSRMPLSLFVFKLVFRNLFNFFLTGLAMLVILMFLKHPFHSQSWVVLPAFFIIVINAVWVTFLLGFITTKFRDFQHLVTTIMRFAFFVTPVVWMASDIGKRANLALYNPFTHFIAIIRDPILAGEIHLGPWIIVTTITVTGILATFFVFAASKKQLIYWL